MSNAPGRNDSRAGPSRRQFLKGSGVTAATAALAGTAEAVVQAATADESKDKTESMGPDPVALTLDVNGAKMETKVEPRVTLLDALRNHLDVTGCKRVCDRGTCGACTVMINGRTVYSCTMLAIEARGADVKTAESLGMGRLDPVPAAFADNDAQQCGFCTPGFVV